MSDLYYVSAEAQFGKNGFICFDLNGNRIYEGMQQASQFTLETRVSNCIVAKAIDAQCAIKSTVNTVIVSFEQGSENGANFIKSVEADGYDPNSLIGASLYGDTIRYEFKKQYALGK